MESIERWWNGLSLRGKLMISILTPSLLVASFMYQFSVQSIMANFNREYRSRALFIGQTLQDSISRGDLMRIDSLQATLEGLARNDDDLLRLTIYVRGSGNGTVLVSSDSSLMGSEASPNDLRPLVTGNAELTEEHDQGASFVEANVPLVIEGEPVGTMGVYLSLEARDALIRSQQINLFTIGGGGVIFMLFLVYFLTERLIVEPVARISRAASRIAAGELDVGLPELGTDEVGHLASSVGKMVNQLLEDRRTMERLATTDGLTDLWNYRYFQDRLQEELDRAVRVEETLSVIIFDLDRFKAFNDTYGHVRGDEVLKVVGRILRSSVRPYDVPCRYGGEEFTVIAPGSDAEGAREIAERSAIASRRRTSHKREVRRYVLPPVSAFPTIPRMREVPDLSWERQTWPCTPPKERGVTLCLSSMPRSGVQRLMKISLWRGCSETRRGKRHLRVKAIRRSWMRSYSPDLSRR